VGSNDISGETVVEVDSSSLLVASNGTSAIGITTGAAIAGANATVQYSGIMTLSYWAWTPNLPIYQSVNGGLTQDPAATGLPFVRQIATAISSTKIEINLFPPIITA
jgi:hypothetical protein